MKEDLKSEITSLWGGSHIEQYEKYLGLPPMVGRSKHRTFLGIKQKFWQIIQVWKGNLLSQGEREVLIKAIAMSISTYVMSCFKLLASLCHELERMMAQFLWSKRSKENKLHWANWGKMCIEV